MAHNPYLFDIESRLKDLNNLHAKNIIHRKMNYNNMGANAT